MTYKIIQWATGAMGKTCLRAIIDHPELELALARHRGRPAPGYSVHSLDHGNRVSGESGLQYLERPDQRPPEHGYLH